MRQEPIVGPTSPKLHRTWGWTFLKSQWIVIQSHSLTTAEKGSCTILYWKLDTYPFAAMWSMCCCGFASVPAVFADVHSIKLPRSFEYRHSDCLPEHARALKKPLTFRVSLKPPRDYIEVFCIFIQKLRRSLFLGEHLFIWLVFSSSQTAVSTGFCFFDSLGHIVSSRADWGLLWVDRAPVLILLGSSSSRW